MTENAFREGFTKHEADIQNVADPLIDFSFQMIEEKGGFLPHGAVVSDSGEVKLVEAEPDGDHLKANPQVLPVLHDGLRGQVGEGGLRAVATAEQVKVAIDGADMVNAIKLVFESRDDFCLTVYVPYNESEDGQLEAAPNILSATEAEIIKGDWPA